MPGKALRELEDGGRAGGVVVGAWAEDESGVSIHRVERRAPEMVEVRPDDHVLTPTCRVEAVHDHSHVVRDPHTSLKTLKVGRAAVQRRITPDGERSAETQSLIAPS